MSEPNPNPNPSPDPSAPAAWHGEAHKDFVAGKGWKSGDDALTSYKNLETLVGAEKAGRTIVLPKDDADVEGVKAFREKLGVPADVKGYKAPEALKDDPLMPAVAAAALKHGIPAKAYEGFVSEVLAAAEGLRTKADGESKAASDTALASVKAKHGDKFDGKVELGKRAVAALGLTPEDLAKMESALGTAKLMEHFISMGEKLGEAAPGGGTNQGGGSVSKDEAKKQIDELRQQRIANKITEAEFNEKMSKLGPIAFPGEFAT